MANSVDHQLDCLGRRAIGYRCSGGRASHSKQRSVPSHDADPDHRRDPSLVLRAVTTEVRLDGRLPKFLPRHPGHDTLLFVAFVLAVPVRSGWWEARSGSGLRNCLSIKTIDNTKRTLSYTPRSFQWRRNMRSTIFVAFTLLTLTVGAVAAH